jgi:hypothetical protein
MNKKNYEINYKYEKYLQKIDIIAEELKFGKIIQKPDDLLTPKEGSFTPETSQPLIS